MDTSADVIIIGGGAHGASLAFHLAKKGVQSLVLERRFVASGATGRSSGLVRMHYDLEPESRLAWESYKYFWNWSEMVGMDCGFNRTGFLQFVRPEFDDQLRANVAMHQRIGIPSLLVTPDDVRRIAPGFNVDDIDLAAFEPESGYADPSSTVALSSMLPATSPPGTGCRVTAKSQGRKVVRLRPARDFHPRSW
jgi:sarcosine oxidase subunit beta